MTHIKPTIVQKRRWLSRFFYLAMICLVLNALQPPPVTAQSIPLRVGVSTSSVQSLNLAKPSNVMNGDLLIAIVTTSFAYGGVQPPSGWTLIRHVDQQDQGIIVIDTYYRIVDASEPPSWSWQLGSPNGKSSARATGSMIAYRGVNATTPIGATNTQCATEGTNTSVASMNTTTANNLVLAIFAEGQSNNTYMPPAGLSSTSVVNVTNGEQYWGNHHMSGDLPVPTAGATGHQIATDGKDTGSDAAQLIAIQPNGSALPVRVGLTTSSSASLNIAKPSNLMNGDVLLATVASSFTYGGISAPAGWTLINHLTQDEQVRIIVLDTYYRVVDGSEPPSWQWQLGSPNPNSNATATGSMIAYRGVNTTNPIGVTGNQCCTGGTSTSVASITTTTPNNLILAIFAEGQSNNTYTPPAGLSSTSVVNVTNGEPNWGNHHMFGEFAMANAGATADQVATDGKDTGSDLAQLIALRPAASNGPGRLDPANRTGGSGEDPLSRNFNWSTSLVGLPGRAGLDLGLSLSYNSLVWTRNGGAISFNNDHGFPAPGFRLGFPVIQAGYFNNEVGQYAFMLITPNGERVELRRVGTSGLYESADSSHLLLDTSTMVLRTTDGTQLSYAAIGGEYQCTQIKDRNGNFITVNYTSFGLIDTVVDTLGRTIRFNYDGSNALSSISQTWTVNGQPLTHTWASFAYADQTMQTNFAGLTNYGPQNNSTVKVLNQVTLDDGSRFNFDYTSWGQVWKISNSAADGHLLNYRSYNLRGSPMLPSGSETDCPRFTERHDWAENWNRSGSLGSASLPTGPEQEVVTSYAAPAATTWTLPDGTQQEGVMAQVTQPNGVSDKIYFAGTAGTATGWQRGLASMIETYDSASTSQRKSVTTWTQDNTSVSYMLNPRVTETNVYDPANNRARTSIAYQNASLGDGTSCYLPQDVREYQADATTVLRSTHTEYNLSSAYTSRRIIGLVSEKRLYEGDIEATLMSRVGYQYDEGGSLLGSDAPTQHDNTNYSSGFVTGRANLSSVKRYDVTNTSQFSVSTLRYNTAGAVVAAIDPRDHQVSVSYADSFSESPANRNTLAYPTQVTDADGFTSNSTYNFDFGAVTRTQGPPPAGQSTGAIKHFTYDSSARIQKVAVEFNGDANYSYTRFEYPASGNRVDTYATLVAGLGEAHSFKIADGHGRVFASAADHPGSVGGFSGQLILFDYSGRAIKSSNPTETSASGVPHSWVAAGDDASAGWLYTQQTYDWKGRPRVTTNQDGTTKEATYSGCGCAGGEVVTLTDEGTLDGGVTSRRQQKVYSDVLGRHIKTEVLNWHSGSVYTTTVNTYNARDQITLVRQHEGVEGSGAYQDTTMTYDGYGRLKTKHVPEQNAGTATTWDYYSDDTVQKITDARGSVSNFTYNNRHLTTGITYDPSSGVADTPDVSFTYDAAGNRTSMTDGLGTVSYAFNQISQLTSETRSLTGVGNFTLTYEYHLGGNLKSVTDPFAASITYSGDRAGRLNAVNGAGFGTVTQYATGMQYRAWGNLSRLTYGNSSAPQTTILDYNSRMLVSRQEIRYANTNVLEQAEEYQYNGDGTVHSSQRPTNLQQERSYRYDHVGRIVQALTAEEARGQTVTDANEIPFAQSYGYDVWGNLTARNGKYWGQTATSLADTYVNNRNTAWTYAADGNLLQQGSRQFTYDAAGQNLSITEPPIRVNRPSLSVTEGYDGDGRRVKRIANGLTSYELHSSALGGAVITKLDAQGNKTAGYVYANGSLLATQTPATGTVSWVQKSAGGNGEWTTFSNAIGTVRSVELDPLLNDVGVENPSVTGGVGGDGRSYPNYGDPVGPHTCALNDNVMPCDYVMKVLGRDHAQSLFSLIKARMGFVRTTSTSVFYDGDSVLLGKDYTTTVNEKGWLVGPSVTVGPTAEVLETIESVNLVSQWSVSRGFPQNTDIISLHNSAHSNYANCTSILTNSPAAKLKGDMALHFVDEATALSVLDTSALEGVDATLIAAMWAAESSFGLNPSNHYRAGDGGEDIGPMQLANTVWNKSPYIDNLGDVFGTNQSRGGTFNGNPYANLRAGARAINDAGGSRANKAGVFRAGASWAKTKQGIAAYNSRVRQFNAWAKTYDDFFDCLRRR